MNKNTPLDDVSRDVSETAGQKPGDDAAKRVATMEKVETRLREVIERLNLIDQAVGITASPLISEHPLGEVVDITTGFADVVGELEEAVKKLSGRVSYIKEVSIPARMDADMVKTFNTDKNRITRTIRMFASIMPDMQERAFKWLRDNNLGSIIKETVNSSSLSAAAKEQMENGVELPEDIFRTHMKDGVSITKLKKK